MLLLLSGRRTDEDELINASFADMGVAIESLLRGEHMEDGDDVAEGMESFDELLQFISHI